MADIEQNLEGKECAAVLESATFTSKRRCAFTVATDGFKAFESVSFIPFDIIFIDSMLNDITPVDFARTLRRVGIRAPIVLLDAHATANHLNSVMNAGVQNDQRDLFFAGTLRRPFSNLDLCEVIEQTLSISTAKVPAHVASNEPFDQSLRSKRARPASSERMIPAAPALHEAKVPRSMPFPLSSCKVMDRATDKALTNDLRQILVSLQSIVSYYDDHLHCQVSCQPPPFPSYLAVPTVIGTSSVMHVNKRGKLDRSSRSNTELSLTTLDSSGVNDDQLAYESLLGMVSYGLDGLSACSSSSRSPTSQQLTTDPFVHPFGTATADSLDDFDLCLINDDELIFDANFQL